MAKETNRQHTFLMQFILFHRARYALRDSLFGLGIWAAWLSKYTKLSVKINDNVVYIYWLHANFSNSYAPLRLMTHLYTDTRCFAAADENNVVVWIGCTNLLSEILVKINDH